MDMPVREGSRLAVPDPLPFEVAREHAGSWLGSPLKFTALVAPAGYGKTTLLAQFARAQAYGAVWLRLDKEDRDARALLRGVAEASRTHGVDLPLWEAGWMRGGSVPQLIAALADDLNAHAGDLTFILDGGEHLSAESARVAEALIHALGEGHRVRIAQHDGSRLSAAPFVARGEGQVWTAQALAFTPAEVGVLAARLGAVVSPEEVYTAYDGWPTATVLALRDTQTLCASPLALIGSGLERLPEQVRAALPELSVTDEWSAAAARQLEVSLPPGWLEEVLRAGLPLTPLGEGRYMPNAVLLQHLREHLAQDPLLWRARHAQRARALESGGQLLRALRHYVEAEEPARALRLAEALAERYERTADWTGMREGLQTLPDAVLTRRLRSLLALALLETGDVEAGEALARAQLAQEPTATAHLTLALVAYRRGDLPQMDREITRGMTVAGGQRDIIQLLRFQAAHRQAVGDLVGALRLAEEAVRRAEGIGDIGLKVAAITVKAYTQEQMNDRTQARLEYERAVLAGQNLGLTGRLVPLLDRLSALYLSEDRTEEADALLTGQIEAFEATNTGGTFLLRAALARVRHVQGRAQEALELGQISFQGLMDIRDTRMAGHALHAFYYVHLLNGTPLGALEDWERAVGDVRAAGYAVECQSLTMRAFRAFARGRADEAQERLREIWDLSERAGQPAPVLACLLDAELALRAGTLGPDHARAITTVLEVRREELADVRMVYGHFAGLLEECVRQGWEARTLLDVVERCLGGPDPQAKRAVLHLVTLGQLGAQLGGENISVGYSPALEALVYWALTPGVRQDDLACQVWSTAPSARAKVSVSKARSTLNKVFRLELASRGAVLLGDLLSTPGRGVRNPEWVLNPAVRLTCDAQEVLSAQTVEGVLALYHGPFLPGIENDWVVDRRAQIDTHVLGVLQRGAAEREAHGDPAGATALLVKAASLIGNEAAYEGLRSYAVRTGTRTLH